MTFAVTCVKPLSMRQMCGTSVRVLRVVLSRSCTVNQSSWTMSGHWVRYQNDSVFCPLRTVKVCLSVDVLVGCGDPTRAELNPLWTVSDDCVTTPVEVQPESPDSKLPLVTAPPFGTTASVYEARWVADPDWPETVTM